jgi:hypothetical protein
MFVEIIDAAVQPDMAAVGTEQAADELWRKLGDDEERKAAYRGRCLKPA